MDAKNLLGRMPARGKKRVQSTLPFHVFFFSVKAQICTLETSEDEPPNICHKKRCSGQLSALLIEEHFIGLPVTIRRWIEEMDG